MIMKKLFLLFLLVCSISKTFGQTGLEYFPSDLNIQPFAANMLEPKLGFLFQFDKNELRLDIGSSMDLIHYKPCEDQLFSLGADLFTYTLLRGETDFHFPVDAVDYLFGLNFGYKQQFEKYEIGARLRISHISAHFVDGHYNGTENEWRDGRFPRVYSREFLELMPYINYENIRFYIGYTYLYHVDPLYIGKNNLQAGFDYYAKDMICKYISPFAGYDIKLVKIGEYTANNSLHIGVKFGNAEGRGLSISYQFYSGKSIHGEYFDYQKKYSSIGLNLDL